MNNIKRHFSILLVALLLNGISVNAQNQDKYSDYLKTSSGLRIKVTQPGNGPMPKQGDKCVVNYTGKLENDTVFDSSIKSGKPFSFEIGSGQVIKGWDEGIALLRQGSKATLVIPPELGYGSHAQAKIPANSILIFDVELLQVIPGIKIDPFDVAGKDTVKTSSGLKYIVSAKGKGAKVEKGKNVQINYSAYFIDGKMFDSSVKKGQPLKFPAGTGAISLKGLEEGVMLMSEGDKIRFIIPPELGLPANPQQKGGPGGQTLIFDVELLKVMPEIKITPYDIQGKEVKTTASGLKYIEVKKSNGKLAESGKTVVVHYTGYLENGNIFDSSVKRDEPIKFKLGSGQVIKGWEEGIALMGIGDKFRFIIPASLAYGDKEMGQIPANSTLIFDVELVDVQ
ncbi:MAG: FKBP-type peptidyl-prolyl cis-trans isomerase [Bacteroidia bacterium]|nr:FKBP-type peptidyl-prolyl cis-trans isomerase [Bacteroidia bacterium]